MKSLFLLGFTLILIPAILANPWGGPNTCVVFYSVRADEQLVASWQTHDRDRRHLSLTRGQGDLWVVTKDEKYADHYKITHKSKGEVLFESEQYHNGNYVFTWIKKSLINDGGASWNIISAGNGAYYIKNKKFGHCLWTIGKDGWVGAYKGCDQYEYAWKIWKIAC